jgi:sec-independent protein translocase protein TatA
MPFNLGGPELMIVLVIILIVFGAGRLPNVMRDLGSGVREFRKAQNETEGSPRSAGPTAPVTPVTPASPVTPGSPVVSAGPAPGIVSTASAAPAPGVAPATPDLRSDKRPADTAPRA